MNNPLLSLLGLCRRANKLSIGFDPVMSSLRHKKSKLVLFSSDLSQNTVKKIINTCIDFNINYKNIPFSMDEIGNALGKKVGVMSIEDAGFAKKISSVCSVLCEEEIII